jgi:hypothetical protein
MVVGPTEVDEAVAVGCAADAVSAAVGPGEVDESVAVGCAADADSAAVGPVGTDGDAVALAATALGDSPFGAGVAVGAAHPMTVRDRASSAAETLRSGVGRTAPPDASPP